MSVFLCFKGKRKVESTVLGGGGFWDGGGRGGEGWKGQWGLEGLWGYVSHRLNVEINESKEKTRPWKGC